MDSVSADEASQEPGMNPSISAEDLLSLNQEGLQFYVDKHTSMHVRVGST